MSFCQREQRCSLPSRIQVFCPVVISTYVDVYLSASMVNSSVSRQWFCERNAMKAVNVHGAGAVFDNISCSDGGWVVVEVM